MGNELKQWILNELPSHSTIVQPAALELIPLPGDAGFRQYFRINTQPALLVVSAPKTEGNSESALYFADLATQMRDQGVPTPQVIACNEKLNLLLIEDLGSQDFLSVLNDDNADLLYGEVLMVLLRLQQISPNCIKVPDYNQELLRKELQLFPDWFVTQLLAYELSQAEKTMLEQAFEFLEQQALEQPRVLVHRDFHSRNLMYRDGEAPGVIDFQDAVWGPITYDLVSLLRDCYIRWSPEQVKRWMTTYANLAIELGLMPITSEARWQQWFDFMGVQRHLKVLGIFSRLYLRDDKPSYLQDLPLVWYYILEVASQYPQLSEFYAWCETVLFPLVKDQEWYAEISPLK